MPGKNYDENKYQKGNDLYKYLASNRSLLVLQYVLLYYSFLNMVKF